MAFIGLLSIPFMYLWLWNIGGKEVLEFTANTLVWKRVLFGISRTHTFSMTKIRNPRFEGSRRRGKSRVPSGIGFLTKVEI
jgi:hypothetical protein